MVRNSANTNPHRRAEKVQMSATTLRVAPIRTCPAPAAGIKDEGHAITQKDGRLLGVEVKAQAGRLRPEQAVFLERIRCAGGVAFVARDLRDVLRELGEAQGP